MGTVGVRVTCSELHVTSPSKGRGPRRHGEDPQGGRKRKKGRDISAKAVTVLGARERMGKTNSHPRPGKRVLYERAGGQLCQALERD